MSTEKNCSDVDLSKYVKESAALLLDYLKTHSQVKDIMNHHFALLCEFLKDVAKGTIVLMHDAAKVFFSGLVAISCQSSIKAKHLLMDANFIKGKIKVKIDSEVCSLLECFKQMHSKEDFSEKIKDHVKSTLSILETFRVKLENQMRDSVARNEATTDGLLFSGGGGIATITGTAVAISLGISVIGAASFGAVLLSPSIYGLFRGYTNKNTIQEEKSVLEEARQEVLKAETELKKALINAELFCIKSGAFDEKAKLLKDLNSTIEKC